MSSKKEIDCHPHTAVVEGSCLILDGSQILYAGPLSSAPDFDDIPGSAKVYLHQSDFDFLWSSFLGTKQ